MLLGASMLLPELRLKIVRSLACGHRRAEGAGRRRCTEGGSANAVRQRRGKLPSYARVSMLLGVSMLLPELR